MKAIRRFKYIVTSIIAMNLILLLLAATASLHYFYQLQTFKSNVESHLAYTNLQDLKTTSLAEILASNDKKEAARQLLVNADIKPMLASDMLIHIKDIEFWFIIYLAVFSLALISCFVLYFYIKAKWHQLVEKQIKKWAKDIAAIAAQYSEGKDWVEDMIYVLLDMNHLNKYRPLVKMYFRQEHAKTVKSKLRKA